MQHPCLGKTVKPAIETATGTSSLQGMAADKTRQQAERQSVSNMQSSTRVKYRTMALGIEKAAAVVLALDSHDTKGKEHGSCRLATALEVEAADSGLMSV